MHEILRTRGEVETVRYEGGEKEGVWSVGDARNKGPGDGPRGKEEEGRKGQVEDWLSRFRKVLSLGHQGMGWVVTLSWGVRCSVGVEVTT